MSKVADRIAGMIPKLITAFVLIFLLVPLIITVAQSFSSPAIIFPPESFSLKLYPSLLSREDFRESLTISLTLAICTSVLSLAIGIPSAFALARWQFRGKKFLNTLLFSPLMVPGVVTGVALLTFFAGLRILTFIELMIGHFILTLPYVTRMVSAGLMGLDRTLEEAAMNLGADEIQTTIKITLPLMKATILAALIFVFQMSFNDVAIAIFLSTSRVYTLPIVLLSWSYFFFDPTVLAASGFILLATTVLVLIAEKIIGIDKLIGTVGQM